MPPPSWLQQTTAVCPSFPARKGPLILSKGKKRGACHLAVERGPERQLPREETLGLEAPRSLSLGVFVQ